MPSHVIERFLMKWTRISEQSSPFRRWTTGSGAGSSYRHHDHRNMYNKQMSECTANVCSTASGQGGSGGVSRWSLGLEQLLADPAGAAAFAHFLAKEFAAENIKFWWSCEQFNKSTDSAQRSALAQEIFQRHLAENCSEPVNVDAAARRATALRLHLQPPPDDLFLQAQKQIFNVMKFDSYPRFLRSAEHAECARADLRGQPPPYTYTYDAHTSAETTPTKLKKSASNASERRRSGGASLLPWRLRTASRDRGSDNNSQSGSEPPTPPVTDVVKSCQTAPGQCSLCRVVLPDGATSVVGVQADVTVRRLVDRLLQRRNLHTTSYDVLLKDEGETKLIDINSPSTILGGKEVCVERRVVLRISVEGRWYGVRCRPARPLRHVLRPVLQRYGAPHAAVVLRDEQRVAPDTLVQELDGARLRIVPLSEVGSCVLTDADCRPDREDDVDSLSDLALAQEDGCSKEQNGVVDCGSLSCATSVSSVSSAINSSGAATGGRVRATVRPGPPLHHHPPDFLENLRETQRRLQSKAPLPARPPPPLPPKPSRAPTLV